MEVVSTNVGSKKEVPWRGKTIQTGIFKYAVEDGILPGFTDVEGDIVVDRKYHGGKDKACYLFSADHYDYFKGIFPNADWQFGIFGENLTVSGLNENELYIGDILRIGGATVQISQPRQPCYKLGIRFGTQKIVKSFIQSRRPGAYVRLLSPDRICKGDSVQLIERQHDSLSLTTLCDLLYLPNPDQELLEAAINLIPLAESWKKDLRKRKRK